MNPPSGLTELVKLDVQEVSGVDEPANLTPGWLLQKSRSLANSVLNPFRSESAARQELAQAGINDVTPIAKAVAQIIQSGVIADDGSVNKDLFGQITGQQPEVTSDDLGTLAPQPLPGSPFASKVCTKLGCAMPLSAFDQDGRGGLRQDSQLGRLAAGHGDEHSTQAFKDVFGEDLPVSPGTAVQIQSDPAGALTQVKQRASVLRSRAQNAVDGQTPITKSQAIENERNRLMDKAEAFSKAVLAASTAQVTREASETYLEATRLAEDADLRKSQLVRENEVREPGDTTGIFSSRLAKAKAGKAGATLATQHHMTRAIVADRYDKLVKERDANTQAEQDAMLDAYNADEPENVQGLRKSRAGKPGYDAAGRPIGTDNEPGTASRFGFTITPGGHSNG